MIQAAAEAGYAKVIYNLALIEQEGQWVEKDLDAAFDGMMRASRMGLIEAKAALGFMCERGLGVPRVDRVSAYAWARLARTHSSVKEYDQTLQTIETALLPTERSRAESYFDTLADLVAYNLQDLRLDPQ